MGSSIKKDHPNMGPPTMHDRLRNLLRTIAKDGVLFALSSLVLVTANFVACSIRSISKLLVTSSVLKILVVVFYYNSTCLGNIGLSCVNFESILFLEVLSANLWFALFVL
jgi:hypothetical protein